MRVEIYLCQPHEPDRYWNTVHALETLVPSRHRLAEKVAADAGAHRARAEPVDTFLCEQEPIHFAGAVQPHAVMLACDPASPDLVVRVCSQTVSEVFGGGAAPNTIGRPLADLLPSSAVTAIWDALANGLLADLARPLWFIS